MNVHSQTDARISEILDAIRHIFVERGFDGASMQDLARGSGMSAGNFYRYFRSKSAIVEAMVAHDLGAFQGEFGEIMSSGEPLALLRAKVAGYVMNESRGALWAEINAAALRKPEIAEICNRMETWIVGRLIEVFAHAAGLPPDRARARFGAHAGVIVLAVKASAIARANTERADVDALVLRMLDSLLDEVVHHEG